MLKRPNYELSGLLNLFIIIRTLLILDHAIRATTYRILSAIDRYLSTLSSTINNLDWP